MQNSPGLKRKRGTEDQDEPRPSPHNRNDCEPSPPIAKGLPLDSAEGTIASDVAQLRPEGGPPRLLQPTTPESSEHFDPESYSPDETLQDPTPDESGIEDNVATGTASSSPQGSVSTGSPPEVCSTLAGVHLSLSDQDANLIDLREVVAGGGFCEVHFAFHRPTGTKLAMRRAIYKRFSTEDILRRFRREADIWATLLHANILPFYGTIEIEQHLYLASPWMALGDLFTFVQEHQKYISDGKITEYSTDESLHPFHASFREFNTIREIAAGLEFLHSRDIVHGDIKAKNILLDNDGCVKICDFGLTKATFHDVTSTELKGVGSIRWQSPELLDDGPKTLESDIYALSMTIAEILTANYPLPHLKQQNAFLKAVLLHGERPTPSPKERLGTPFGLLWGVAGQCWEKYPPSRPKAKEVLLTLDRIPLDLHARHSDLVGFLRGPISVDKGLFDLFTGIYRPTGLKLTIRRSKSPDINALAEAFMKTAARWSAFRHVNILPLLEMFQIGGQLFFTSPWRAGFTDLIQYAEFRAGHAKHPNMAVAADSILLKITEVEVVRQLAAGIGYLHSVHFIHGNIRARNALFSVDGTVRLYDYGFAESGSFNKDNNQGLRWAAPELLHAAEPAKGFRSDVYAFGMTIVELLTGNWPLPHIDGKDLRNRLLFGERPHPHPMSQLGVDFTPLWELAAACWKWKPEERPSMKEVIGHSDLTFYRPIYPKAINFDFVNLHDRVPVTSGATYDVYIGVHRPSQLKLAIKRLRDGHLRPASEERVQMYMTAYKWRSLSHVNILPVFDPLPIENDLHLMCQWMELGDLRTFTAKRLGYIKEGRLEDPSLDPFYSRFREPRIIYEIAAGIAYLHALDIAHGTIRAPNILLDGHGRVQIGSVDSAHRRHGCRACLAINQGDNRADCISDDIPSRWALRSESPSMAGDLYAFSMTIVEILTGTFPFPLIKNADVQFEVNVKQTRPSFNPTSCLDVDFKPLWNLAAQCWKANHKDRPSMKQVKATLEELDLLDFKKCVSEGKF